MEERTTTGANHPESSFAAARSVLPASGTQRRKVYDCIAGFGPVGATDDAIAVFTGLNPNSVRPRRVELAQAGLIYRTGDTRKNFNGNACDLWAADIYREGI